MALQRAPARWSSPAAEGRAGGQWLQRLQRKLGGRARTRVVVLFACALALETADLTSLGAVAGRLKPALGLSNTDLGVLAAAPSLVAAAATLPFGVLADRLPRVRLLGASICVWAVAMALSAASSSFAMLLLVRMFLGASTAAAGPLVASLVGDLFWPGERGRIYGYILAGQLLGTGFGLLVSGNLASVSWRAGLLVLAIPSVAVAWLVLRTLDEPARGGAGRLPSTRAGREGGAAGTPREDQRKARRDPALARAARSDGAQPRAELVLRRDPQRMALREAVVYVLRLPTNLALIVSSSLGYFFQAGVNTFGVVFVIAHFGVSQSAATSLLALVALGALAGTVGGGRLADLLLSRGYLPARMVVGGCAFLLSAAFFVPGLLSRVLLVSMPLYFVAACSLAAPAPALDAARLDIMPARLWGRAEAIRTVMRTLAVAAAPLVFGFVSDSLGGGHRATTKGLGYHASGPGLKYTFLLMLIPMVAGALVLLRAVGSYRRDVATAVATEAALGGERGG